MRAGLLFCVSNGRCSHNPDFMCRTVVAYTTLILVTFYKRNFARKKGEEDVPPLSTALTNRLHQIINAEISAILSIPILATLMARGVGYNADFPFQIGLVVSILATGGSFFFYSKQALGWDEEEEGSVIVEQQG